MLSISKNYRQSCVLLFLLCLSTTLTCAVEKSGRYHYLRAGVFSEQHHAAGIHTIDHIKLANGSTAVPKQTRPYRLPELSPQHPLMKSPTKISAKSTSTQKRLWNLREVDIRSVIAEVSRETGKNFLVDSRVQGKISIVSSTPIGANEVYQMFLSVLQISGYSAIKSGDIIKIIPDIESKSFATPLSTTAHPGQGDENVVRVIKVKYVPAEQLVPILRPLLPQWGNLTAYGPSNAIIISGRANNIQRLARIIKRVDTADHNGVNIITLHNALAQDVVKTIKSLQPRQQSQRSQQVSIAADDRSNSILVTGDKQARLRMRVLISDLDMPSPSGLSGNTEVIYLQYLRAKDIVPILAGVARSNFHGRVGTTIGTMSANKLRTDDTQGYTDEAQGSSQFSPEDGTQAPQTTTSTADSKPRVEIIGEPNTNSIIINAPLTLMRTLKMVIAKIDIRPAQVLVEALIAEVNERDLRQLGIQWGNVITADTGLLGSGGEGSGRFQAGIGVISRSVIDNKFKNYQAVIRALANNNKADILSTPSIMVLDNHQARILVGKQVSISESEQPSSAGGTTVGTPFQTFTRQDVALHLYVTPQISQGKTVLLTIDQGNDTLENPNDPTTTPQINRSSIKTTVLINSGDVLVLGGLIQNQLSANSDKIPILGDIPIIGHFFRERANSHEKRNLMVFLRPIIINNQQEGLRVSGDKYQHIRHQQLAWLQNQPYNPDAKELSLPPWGKQIKLPEPFSNM